MFFNLASAWGSTSIEYSNFGNAECKQPLLVHAFTMTEKDKELLINLDYGRISYGQLLKKFSVHIKQDTEFVRKEMSEATGKAKSDEIRMTLPLIWLSGDIYKFIDILNELLINPNHRKHQEIAKGLQDYPSSAYSSICKKSLGK